MSIKRVTFTSGGNKLEAILSDRGDRGGAVICHPHPLYGGSMQNNVVEALEEGFALSGMSTLKFNFRGVGASDGVYDEGNGEVADTIAACGFMTDFLSSGARLVLSGYSFGAWVAARAAAHAQGLEDLVLVAYPFSIYDSSELKAYKGRIYLVGGSLDDISPLDPLLSVYRDLQAEKWLKVLPSSHFFSGVERELRDFVHHMFGPPSETAPQASKKD